MPDVVLIERKDRDNGTSHIWATCEGERVRLVIQTATLNAPEGHHMLTLMASRAAQNVKEARAKGAMPMEGDDGDSGL